VHALLRALRFDQPETSDLHNLTPAQWRKLLDLADREHLTIPLALRCGADLPEWVRSRIEKNLAACPARFLKIQTTYREISDALDALGIEFAVLKGFSHWPGYSPDPQYRPQYDLDLLFRPEQIYLARDVLQSLGFEPLGGFDALPIDHLPAMIRKTGWRWRGDYFDVDIPLAVELHFRLWDSDTEHLAVPGLDAFWARRTQRYIEQFCFPALDPVDTLAYATLHLLRHLLRGDVRLYHVYELAYFLDGHADDAEFWNRWAEIHPEGLSAVQAVAFRFAAEWFGCRLSSQVAAEIERASEPVQRWFRLFAINPVDARVHPNKNELWLHLSLLESRADKRSVAIRRLFPMRGHRAMYAPHVPDAQATWRLRIARRAYQAGFTLVRLGHHVRSTVPTLAGGFKFWWTGKGLDPQLLRFLAAAALFNFGMAVFFLLYNIFLIQRGFHEDFLGAVSSAMSLGSIAGTLPAAFILHRFGIRTTLVTTFLAGPLVCVARVLAIAPAALVASAFLNGFLFSFYAVSLAPAVAQLTSERSRAFGFSLVFSLGIGIGVAAGLAGGRLPALLGHTISPDAIQMQRALLIACGIAIFGAIAAWHIRFTVAPSSEKRVYPRGKFITRFLFALLIWNIATGAFNPFFNAYFVNRLGISVAQVGTFYSAAQIFQVLAVLSAPIILRRAGVITGVMGMQLATACALGGLALGPPVPLAGAIYAGYMGFQYMSEPGIYTLLMDGVSPHERSGASAMNFLVVFGGQALAAAIAGAGVRRFGYPVVLMIAAITAVFASFAFRLVPGAHTRSKIESTS
jgi:MFS family permease